jgi:hypothetical protein
MSPASLIDSTTFWSEAGVQPNASMRILVARTRHGCFGIIRSIKSSKVLINLNECARMLRIPIKVYELKRIFFGCELSQRIRVKFIGVSFRGEMVRIRTPHLLILLSALFV